MSTTALQSLQHGWSLAYSNRIRWELCCSLYLSSLDRQLASGSDCHNGICAYTILKGVNSALLMSCVFGLRHFYILKADTERDIFLISVWIMSKVTGMWFYNIGNYWM